jgi:hypothetical protein
VADHSNTFEIAIAALGLLITGALGYGQYRLSSDQAKLAAEQQNAEQRRAADNIEVQVMSLVAPHFGNLTKPGTEFEASQRVVLAAAEYLSSQHSRTALAIMAARISERNAGISAEVKSRIQEATSSALPTGQWFVVLASLPGNDESAARDTADRKQKLLAAAGEKRPVQLWRTKISNNFAIVLGEPTNRDAAIELASTARSNNIAKDAFAQQDRDWRLISTGPFKQ